MRIEQDGTVDAFEMTGGSSLLNPMYLFRGGAPVKEFVEVMPQSNSDTLARRFLGSQPDGTLITDGGASRTAFGDGAA